MRVTYRGVPCTETLGRSDGSFELRVPDRCFRDGQTVFWTSGGLDACVTTPFRSGVLAHLTLFGRTTPCL